jgi:cytochrome oxidase Cu insertion factor (SCO1/SenC/PrrC family)
MHLRRFPRWLGAAAAALTVTAGIAVAFQDTAPATADLDKPVKDFKVTDIMSGKEVALSDFKGKPVVLSSISYTCGTSWRYEKRMGKMIADYGKKGVVFVNMNSNANNTEEGMKKYVEARHLDMIPLLKDKENRVADYLNTRVTPTFYVLDKDHVLRYRGAFDDNPDEGAVTKSYVVPAVDAVLAGKPVEVKEARPFG